MVKGRNEQHRVQVKFQLQACPDTDRSVPFHAFFLAVLLLGCIFGDVDDSLLDKLPGKVPALRLSIAVVESRAVVGYNQEVIRFGNHYAATVRTLEYLCVLVFLN